jgi:hypothetical protein
VRWRAEYATSPTGPWTKTNEGLYENSGGGTGEVEVFLGTEDKKAGGPGLLQHLKPKTLYYFRFLAESTESSAKRSEKVDERRTLPIGPPEIVEGAPVYGGKAIARLISVTPKSVRFIAPLETNGAQTTYHFEYSASSSGSCEYRSPISSVAPWRPFTVGAEGTITSEEDFKSPGVEAEAAGLSGETQYYACITADNGVGAPAKEVVPFKTPTGKPEIQGIGTTVRNVTATTASVVGSLLPHGSETRWRFEYRTAGASAWQAGPEGVISDSEAKALTEGSDATFNAELTGLKPGETYHVRLFAENQEGEGEVCIYDACEAISSATEGIAGFETAGVPASTAFATHAVHGESLRVLGSVNPRSAPTSAEQRIKLEGAPASGTFTLTFDGETTEEIAFDAPAERVREALSRLQVKPSVEVTGAAGGPYTVFFDGASGESSQPPMTATSNGFKVNVVVLQKGGEAYATKYNVEYVSESHFKEKGFAESAATKSVDLGTGNEHYDVKTHVLSFEPVPVGSDLPTTLQPGETYRFRIHAMSTSGGESESQEQIVRVPAIAAGATAASCANEALRSGPAAQLPDCRAYEQVTPVEKEGSEEMYKYGLTFAEGTTISEDGEHVMFASQLVKWGKAPAGGQSPYFFTRTSEGWRMAPGAPQPEAGIQSYQQQVFSPDLTQFGFAARWRVSSSFEAQEVEFKAGPVGGPYKTAAVVPRKSVETESEGWVGASEDFSKLILAVKARNLLGHPTGTKEGSDLYEYAPSNGTLHQINVTTAGATIGTCGAQIAHGESSINHSVVMHDTHPVSHDGSLVFFQAIPGSGCSTETPHLYARLGSSKTEDLGAYRFRGYNGQTNTALVEKDVGETAEFMLLGLEGHTVTPLFTLHQLVHNRPFLVSGDGSAIYFSAEERLTPDAPAPNSNSLFGVEDLYRYDVAQQTLGFVAEVARLKFQSTSRNGRYLYFSAEALPGLTEAHNAEKPRTQVYRYDDVEHAVQCLSCSSWRDPELNLNALFTDGGGMGGVFFPYQGVPENMIASEDGAYVFFDTTQALVPQDVDGELAPFGNESDLYSSSSDIYEWRAPGASDCAQVAGCLSLITSGLGGNLNILLGTTANGRDVFFYSSEKLVTPDSDTAGDIYDARVDGGFTVPLSPPPCDGDACLKPAPAPVDLTPSSLVFSGPGNLSIKKAKSKGKICRRKRKCGRARHIRRSKKRMGKRHPRSGKRGRGVIK